MCHAREFVLLLVSNLPTGGFRQESEVIEFFFFRKRDACIVLRGELCSGKLVGGRAVRVPSHDCR